MQHNPIGDKEKGLRVYIATYGCQMNEYDSELIRSFLVSEGFVFVQKTEAADVILLNTCAVRENARRRVEGHIHELRHQMKGREVVIGILGCLATHLKEDLLKDKSLGLSFICGPDSYLRLGELIRVAGDNDSPRLDIELKMGEMYAHAQPLRAGGVNAWVAVTRGCNNFCSFCVVPYTRGRERSRTPEDILEEVRQAAKQGFRQVSLLGQNVNSYGHGQMSFAQLLEKVAKVPGIARIRFMSPHPKDFPEDLIRIIADNQKVCKHIHLPLQAGNDRILKLMNRGYTKAKYLDLVKRIKTAVPGLALTTDIIVGFPSETEQEFEDTKDVMQQVRYDAAFIFKYSERKGTLAQKKYPDDVSPEEKTKRIVKLNDLQKHHSLVLNQALIGRRLEVLIEADHTSRSADDIQGRTDGNKLVILPATKCSVGDIFPVEITDATPHVLKAVPA